MKKIYLTLILAFMFPIIVSADITTNEEFINVLGGTEYAELNENKITLKQDVILTEQIKTTSGTYTIDLNGYKISTDENNPINNYIMHFENSTVTIEDNKGTGSIDVTEDSTVILANKKTSLTINNIKMNTIATAIHSIDGTLTLNGGEYTSSDSTALYTASVIGEVKNAKFTGKENVVSLQSSTTTITNVEATAIVGEETSGAALEIGSGKATINSGIFTGVNAGLRSFDVDLELNGGTYISTSTEETYEGILVLGGIILLSENEIPDNAIYQHINEEYTLSNDTLTKGTEYDYPTLSTAKNVSIIKKEETITYTLKNLTTESQDKYQTKNEVSITIKPDNQYILPKKVVVKVSNIEITSGYTYNGETGVITIPSSLAIGPIEIIANADVENPNTSNSKAINLIICSIIPLILFTTFIIRENKIKRLNIN